MEGNEKQKGVKQRYTMYVEQMQVSKWPMTKQEYLSKQTSEGIVGRCL